MLTTREGEVVRRNAPLSWRCSTLAHDSSLATGSTPISDSAGGGSGRARISSPCRGKEGGELVRSVRQKEEQIQSAAARRGRAATTRLRAETGVARVDDDVVRDLRGRRRALGPLELRGCSDGLVVDELALLGTDGCAQLQPELREVLRGNMVRLSATGGRERIMEAKQTVLKAPPFFQPP